ncbi:transposon ty3-i Gag-Pol polyprotein [Plakobranchus ocellatus]|uniref:Transposon ty3-i Gag-Pol polyprotein n=1 Tax=Plakobranchus ocellatus TaxID=259542 RepID=A0AAV4D8U2_9GAST|nr:transposon ty3-i Gag-Pol polyprotein [Plakobranchus ocellatus]
MPFGISSAPEIFQRNMDSFFGDLEGVVCDEDDICIFSKTTEEHMVRLKSVLQRARECGLKFNAKKCEFLKEEISYLGHILTKDGIKVDPAKVSALKKMPNPTNKKELQRFLGMVTYSSKYIQDMSQRTAPLRELLEKDSEWLWLERHEKAVNDLKTALTDSPTLKFFDVKKEVSIKCDASKDGLGAVLLQEGQPVAYCSRSMTEAEQRYAQIEKETLAIVYSLERFHQYVYGRKTHVFTDHKPIVAIFKKPFEKCPPRIQRFLLRLQPYSIEINYKKGTEQVLADALSRATENNDSEVTEIPEREMKAFVDSVVKELKAKPQKIEEIKEKQANDPALCKLRALIHAWPDSSRKVPKDVRSYWTVREDVTECNGVLLKGNQIIIPESMKQEMLSIVHQGHLGVELSQNRAKSAIFWPGMLRQIEELVNTCPVCQRFRNSQQKEPLHKHECPDKPWEKVAADLFHFRGNDYLLVCDYFSKYFEANKLEITTRSTTVLDPISRNIKGADPTTGQVSTTNTAVPIKTTHYDYKIWS